MSENPNRRVVTPEMMQHAADEAERYCDAELNDFFRSMREKYGDINIAAGIVHASLACAIGKILRAETQAVFGGELGKAAKARLQHSLDRLVDVVNDYRAEIRRIGKVTSN